MNHSRHKLNQPINRHSTFDLISGSLQRANFPPNNWTPYEAKTNISKTRRIET